MTGRLGDGISWGRRLGSRAKGRLRRRRFEELAALVASLRGREDATIAVLGPANAGLVAAVRAASPRAEVTEVVTEGSERHVTMAALAPFDVILDRELAETRRLRFETTFFHLRAGGTYVVPDGAGELGDRPGPLGDLLDPMGSVPQLRKVRIRLADFRMSLEKHVTRRVVGRDLLLSHDLTDVHAKMREDEFNAYLELADTPHRLLRTIPAEPPPPAPAGREGPDPRDPPMHRPINEATLSLRDYRDPVVFPRQVLEWGGLFLPDTFRHNQPPLLESTRLVDHGPLFARRRWFLNHGDPARLPGTYLHLDNEFRGHFGHLMTETLSRAWSWPAALEVDPDTRVLLSATKKRPKPLEYELELYEACGIPRDRITLIDGPVRVERLISGTPMFSHPEYVHPRIAETWREVGDRLAAGAVDRDWPRRFFVSRRHDKRSCTNGAEVEAIFAEYGFQPIYPEDYSLGEQVRLFRAAEVIAGYAGSGLFQMALVPDPTHVIMVGAASYTMRNEYLMAAVNRHRVDGVFSLVPGTKVQVSYTFDHDREGPFLRGILDELP